MLQYRRVFLFLVIEVTCGQKKSRRSTSNVRDFMREIELFRRDNRCPAAASGELDGHTVAGFNVALLAFVIRRIMLGIYSIAKIIQFVIAFIQKGKIDGQLP